MPIRRILATTSTVVALGAIAPATASAASLTELGGFLSRASSRLTATPCAAPSRLSIAAPKASS